MYFCSETASVALSLLRVYALLVATFNLTNFRLFSFGKNICSNSGISSPEDLFNSSDVRGSLKRTKKKKELTALVNKIYFNHTFLGD